MNFNKYKESKQILKQLEERFGKFDIIEGDIEGQFFIQFEFDNKSYICFYTSECPNLLIDLPLFSVSKDFTKGVHYSGRDLNYIAECYLAFTLPVPKEIIYYIDFLKI